MESLRFRRFRKWFTASFISTVHTWLFCTAFSLTLSTIAFDYSTSEWFETSTYIAVPMGLPSSFTQHGYTCLTSCHKFPPSWRTIVGIYDQTCISFQLWCYHLFKPPYQYVMHIDAGDYRRTDRTLSTSFFGFFKFIVVHNPCLQHPSDKSDNIGVFDPWSYKTYDPFMVKMLEEPFNVCIQYITCWFSLQHQV